jgi:PAS domain S-box-containing protein
MSEKAKIILSFLLSVFVLILVSIYAFFNIGQYKKATSWVSHTQSVILEAQTILSEMQEMETAQREYILIGGNVALKRYRASIRKRDAAYLKLKEMTGDNRPQQLLLDTIRYLYRQRSAISDETIRIKDQSGLEAARRYMLNGTGINLMAAFREKIDRFISNERGLLDIRIGAANRNFTSVILIITGSLLLSIIIILVTMYFFIRDFKRKRLSKKRLIDSELRLKNILNALPVGVFIVDKRGLPYYANTKAKEILGKDIIPGSAIEGLAEVYQAYRAGTKELYPVEDMPIAKALAGQVTLGVEDMELRKDNLIVPVRINAIPLYNSEQSLEYAIAVFEDITKIKEAEYELVNARKLAEQALKIKETFLANMSHEIRTPLNAIVGFTDILSGSDLPDKEKDFIKIIQTSGINLLRIINDILDISKIEAGMMTFEVHPLSIRDIFQSLHSMLQGKIKEKKIGLFFSTDDDVPEVLNGDPVRLTQILLNLIGNAIKFTAEGYVMISARMKSIEDGVYTVSFFIKDTGIGIPEDRLQHIFERFSQVEHSTTRNYGGTGLGLSIARQLVQLQGGTMSVFSKEGSGSEFFFTLPFGKGDLPAMVKEDKSRAVVDFEALRSRSILAVEDNPVNVELLVHMFGLKGLTLDIVHNGKQAVEQLAGKEYDIILMDMELPEMNGYDTTTYIRQQMRSEIPIIAMTAHAMAGEREKCLSLGMNDYISKPLNATLLFEKIYTILFPQAVKFRQAEAAGSSAPQVQELHEDISLAYLKDYSGGSAEFEQEMISMFLKQVPDMKENLLKAYEERRKDDLKGIAHKMKSSVSLFGANVLTRLLSEIEAEQEIEGENMKMLLQAAVARLDDSRRRLETLLKENYQ